MFTPGQTAAKERGVGDIKKMGEQHDRSTELHPLERDYDSPSYEAPKPSTLVTNEFLRTGTITFLVAMTALVLSAILLGTLPRVWPVQTLGHLIHKSAQFAVLVGGCLLVVGYRTGEQKSQQRQLPTSRRIRLSQRGPRKVILRPSSPSARKDS